MKTYGLIWPDGTQELRSIVLDDDGNPRTDTLEPKPKPDDWQAPQVVPLVKIPKPEQGAWEPNVVWFDDRVERQWVAGTPAHAPTYTAEEWVQNYFSSLEIIALTRLEQSILQQGKTLGPKMQACKEWLEAMMFAQPSSTFLPAPYTYSEASIEAASTLNS